MTMHNGHRQRMRERFRKEGLEGFAPHEVLELLLYYARARGDVNPLAHQLLDTFGSLKGVLEAGQEQLLRVKGVGEETAALLGLMLPLFRRYQEELCSQRTSLRNCAAAEQYCKALMAGLRHERLYLLSISTSRMLVGTRAIGEGVLNEVPAYPRRVVEAALNHNAYGIILCHNHPGGYAEPSSADLAMTEQIEALMSHLGMRLVDHIIVSGNTTYSMSQHGHLKNTGVCKTKDGVVCREDEQEYIWLDEGESDR
ncbi:MAG: DNA repair protein RadC [Clostridia bacterium]|nr:DNA repair protein RadC [Clostridia bacterium]